MRLPLLLALLITVAATTASAGSIRVLSHLGSVGGGDIVLIRGDADVQFFSPVCDPAPACAPRVLFGAVPARSVSAFDENTVQVITPAHTQGAVDVTVTGLFGSVTLPRAYTFDGYGHQLSRSNYQAVLVPILLGPAGQPLPGLAGSSWISELWMRNRSAYPVELLTAGYPGCYEPCSPCCTGTTPFPSLAAESLQRLDATIPGSVIPAFLYYVQRGGADALSFSLRVRDVSRVAENLGTEIPIVHEEQFGSELDLLNVPLDPSSRTALRVYGMTGQGSVVRFRIFSMPDARPLGDRSLVLDRGVNRADDVLNDMPRQPSYGVIYDLRAAFPDILPGRYRINVSANSATVGRFWAFASATNNVTQLFTTITPQNLR